MRVRNSSEAFTSGLREILRRGDRLVVRGSSTLEVRSFTFTIERPVERCIILPNRRNNVFATVAETVWVLAGRDDLAYLSHYLPRAGDFSDDGLTWRAAYGPRLRDWNGVDQLHECAVLLGEEPSTRRAVMSIFDPARDFVDSKDIPCNNWIHWLVRDGRLHMDIALRSSDVVWGLSGINMFEWSVLHEVLAHWLGVGVGDASYFISSLHLYDRHEERARSILESAPARTGYELGWTSPRFATKEADLPGLLERWFALELQTRTAPGADDGAIAAVEDPLFRHFLELLQIYNGSKLGWPLDEVDERLAALETSDLTAAAFEYFHRDLDLDGEAALRYLPQLAAPDADRTAQLSRAIARLHAEKSAAYGSSWKQRGEQIGVLANIARKVDRAAHLVASWNELQDESLVDTAVDLLNYSIKYQTFLADLSPAAAAQLFPADQPERPFSDGTGAFDFLLERIDFEPNGGPASVSTAIVPVVAALQTIEDELPTANEVERLRLAQELSRTAVVLVLAACAADPKAGAAFIASYAA
jgi:thymidylate synthase